MPVASKTLNRRSFFENLLGSSNELAINSLEEHTTPLTKEDAFHLLKRCCFSVDLAYAKTLVGRKAKDVINELITNAGSLKVGLPPFDVNQSFRNPNLLGGVDYQLERNKNLEFHFAQNKLLIEWWLDLMKADKRSLSEKITFLWHSHFTTQYDGGEPIPAQWMYRQNILFRNKFLGSFKSFLESITIDGAMLLYLNGSENIKDAPNENYARELLELYSVGIGDGHYTEDDIREAAKVLTGWRATHWVEEKEVYQPYFRPNQYSTDEKTVFDTLFKVDYEVNQQNAYKNAIQRLMEVILEKKGTEVSVFMANKFYRYFVYSKTDNFDHPMVQELAKHFKNNGYDTKSTIVKLLTSKHFFDPNNRGVMIKSPLDSLLGFSNHFEIDTQTLRKALIDFGQEPLNPPNVSGWKGYRQWINTKTLPLFIDTFTNIINAKSDVEVGSWAAKLDGFNDSYKIVEDLAVLFFGRVPKESRLKKVENALLGGAPYYEWPEIAQNQANAGIRVKAAFKEMFRMPEFYLA